ncbi:hypothetical protein GQ43DRAFT_410944 [Delitschia confertaspora ATCC 74209]|uniref:Uncharacterized protein n=1 Tax=Delitschia confertaspora ATCC 74209 TaxID=1513339 RepID=A0A9P4JWB9_9PLEO|nr:hypothetical protein GQ43DRAFT_410944 [Delitschia confertaspora ATCC 74209]
MQFAKRYCVEYVEYFDGTRECIRSRDGFWYSNKGIIVKWIILAVIFFAFMAWFVGGYIHAKSRMRKGLPLLSYHRWLIPYRERQRWGQIPGQTPSRTPQDHFTFYNTQAYGVRPGGAYPEPPPMYYNDAPPQYTPPPGATKIQPNQTYVEMQPQMRRPAQSYGAYSIPSQQTEAYPMPHQQTGVVGESSNSSNHGGLPRPDRVKLATTNFLSRFRK